MKNQVESKLLREFCAETRRNATNPFRGAKGIRPRSDKQKSTAMGALLSPASKSIAVKSPAFGILHQIVPTLFLRFL